MDNCGPEKAGHIRRRLVSSEQGQQSGGSQTPFPCPALPASSLCALVQVPELSVPSPSAGSLSYERAFMATVTPRHV